MRTPRNFPGNFRLGGTSLRNRLVSGALLVIFMLLLMFAGFVYFAGRTLLIDNSLRSLEAVASIQQARIESFVRAGEDSLALVATRARLRTELARMGEGDSSESIQAIESVLVASSEVAPNIEAILIFDEEARRVVEYPDSARSIAVPIEYVRAGLSALQSGLIVEGVGGDPLHLLVGPIELDGEVLGAVVVGQSTDLLLQLVRDHSGLGETGETILAQPNESGAQYIAPLRFDEEATFSPVNTAITQLPMTDAIAGIESGASDGVDYRGADVFAVTRHIDSTGWGIVVKQDRAEVLEPLDDFALLSLGVLAVALVAAYFLAARTAEWIFAPVGRLKQTVVAIASGRRDVRAETDRADELGDLAASFNEMTDQIDSMTLELERRVAERTLELEEKNEQLAQLMEEKETWLAGVSHEVRSPLTAMIGFLDLVNQSGDALDTDERAEMLETVSRQADDVLNLIEDLLASARVEAGTLNVASVRCDLAAQVRQVVEGVAATTRVEIDLEGDGVLAEADPARVRQIIRNLLTNADRYGGPNVEVQMSRVDGVARVYVRDNGKGVPEADRAEIFEAYGQSMSSRKVDGSVGLGLHVSQQLARLMGGDLSYDYVDGWSIFSLVLPEHFENQGAPEGSRSKDLAPAH